MLGSTEMAVVVLSKEERQHLTYALASHVTRQRTRETPCEVCETILMKLTARKRYLTDQEIKNIKT